MGLISKRCFLLTNVFMFLSVLSAFVSAEIFFGRVESVYNVGDDFNLSIKIKPNKDTTDFFIAKLLCEGKEIELYRSPYAIPKDFEKEILISTSLEKELIEDSLGKCLIESKYGGEEGKSQIFDITDKLDVSLDLESALYSPSENVNIRGKVNRIHGTFSGFVEIIIQGINLSYLGQAKEGDFNFNIIIPKDSPAGLYDIIARAYERDENGISINEGIATDIIKIKQIMEKIDIAVNSQTIAPKEELRYTIIIYDQSGGHVNADVSVVISKPDETIFKESIVKTDSTNSIFIENNFPLGNWIINAKLNEFSKEKSFFVEEFRDLIFRLENGMLIVTNTGNVPYNGPIEISINNITEIKEIRNLGVGESKKFKLVAPEGDYLIEVSDNNKKEGLGTIFLTGNAISIDDITESGFSGMIIVWLVVIILAAFFALILYKKISKRKFVGKIPPFTLGRTSLIKEEKQETVIQQGEKQESVIISLNLKNFQNVKENEIVQETINRALWKGKEEGAKIYSLEDYRIIILAPVLTKQQDNTIKALVIAQAIERILKNHNQRFKEKIEFGIGVSIGNLIVETKEDKFKFVSTGNIIAITKRTSNYADSVILISKELYTRLLGKAKMEKLPDKDFWRIDKIIERSQYEDFISKFKLRQRQEEKSNFLQQ